MKAAGGAVNIDVNKALTYGIGAIVVIGVGFFIWRKVKKGFAGLGERQEAKDVVREAGKAVKTTELTYNNIWYETAADRLFQAFDQRGTNENTVWDVIGKLKNKDDWYQLIESFGIRKSTVWGQKFQGNLAQWLTRELKTKREIKKLNETLALINVTL